MSDLSLLLDARLIDRGGIGRYVRELLTAAPIQLGTDRSGAVLPAGESGPVGVRSWVPRRSIPLFGWRGWFGASRWFLAPARLIHFPHFPHPRRWSAAASIFTIHDLIHLKFPAAAGNLLARRYLAGLIRSAVAKASRVIVPSEATARDLVERFPEARSRLHVVPMGVDVERFRAGPPEPIIEPPYWLNVTNGKPHKNLGGLLEAFARTRARRSSRLAIAGDLGERAAGYQRRARQLGLSDRVAWLGGVSDEALVALYRGARGVIIPSFAEGFGLPALEAMAAGVPLAASGVGGLGELAGGAARLFDPEDPGEVAAAWDELDRDEALRRELVSAGSVRCRQFPWSRTIELTFAHYREVIEELAP